MRAVFVVNVSSGGRRGAALDTVLRAQGESVHDLRQGGLERLAAGCEGPLVACGGDGTVAAVLEAVHRSGRDVAVAMVPLGTGNDLARHLGWPLSPPSAEAIRTWLAHALAAPERHLDRWLLEGPDFSRAWYNYWSVGDDAAAAARFHHLRQQQPWLARGGALNKALYGLCGLQEPGGRLRGAIAPEHSSRAGALVAAGIPSYAGGLQLGPAIRSDDGLVDLFALPAGLSLGLVLARLRRARALGQHRQLELRLNRRTPMQIDGEPMLGAPGCWRVRHGGRVRVLTGPYAVDAAG